MDAKKVLTIEYPLVYYHFGGDDPGLAVVGELSGRAGHELGRRRARRSRPGQPKHHADGELSGAPQDHWGGETIIRAGFKEASIQGVEFSFMGKPKLGSYPAHFHMVGAIGNNQTALFNANSIHHSYNKCITVHSTQNLVLQNNVCARRRRPSLLPGGRRRGEHHFPVQSRPRRDEQQLRHPCADRASTLARKWLPLQDPLQRYQLIDRYWWPGDQNGSAQL